MIFFVCVWNGGRRVVVIYQILITMLYSLHKNNLDGVFRFLRSEKV